MKARGSLPAVCVFLCWAVCSVSAVRREHLFPYGTRHGDSTLQEGDDETSEVLELRRPLYFYETQFSALYVATNGIISTQDLPMEKQYVDDGFPTDFPVIAPFLADIDTSRGRGAIYYRMEESPGVLTRVAQEVQRSFPGTYFTPTHAVIATWENVAAYEEVSRNSAPSSRVNTFQAVVAYDDTDSYALFLYPEDGLQFFGTRPKESYNVQLELPARVGFCRGEVSFLVFSRTEGPYYSVTSNEQTVKNLYQVGNTGVPGLWLFRIGNRFSFQNVVPAAAARAVPTAGLVAQDREATTTPDYAEVEYPDDPFSDPTNDYYPTVLTDSEFPPPAFPEYLEPGHSPNLASFSQTLLQPIFKDEPGFHFLCGITVLEPVLILKPSACSFSYFLLAVIQYSTENKETCARFQQTCSQNGYCTDYSSGFCCHCHTGYYGNGRHCLPEGAPQRVNGKVNGLVSVGATPVELDNVDLHAYIVMGDGRAYTAISQVPEPIGWALMPMAPIGGLYGWLFALELPHHQNGFRITGAEFTHYTEAIFYPGNQRLTIVQTAQSLSPENYLSMNIHIRGSVPFVVPGATVQMEPYKEIYQYYPSVITSSSVRDYTVVSLEKGSETYSYQLRQNITYRDCRHGPRTSPESQQLSMERIFIMYDKEERILRYAITNKIGPLREDPHPEVVNPCYAGTHDCDTTAQCLPGEGEQFRCQCATGYRGDGRSCHDVDECAEGLASCGSHSSCVNLPGSHRCQCQSGFGLSHGTCVGEIKTLSVLLVNSDIDECTSKPCHAQAFCLNSLGSFECRCRSGFRGDGFNCLPQSCESPSSGTRCEQHRDSLQGGLGPRGPRPAIGAFVPQCDEEGQYRPLQCHGSTGYCWCVDSGGQEREGTRTPPGPPCVPTVPPPTVRPLPRPDVTPPPSGTSLLYAQGQQIGALPLNGTRMEKAKASVLLALHVITFHHFLMLYRKVYWTDLSGRTINRASLESGAEPETIISTGLTSPEGLAVDARRSMMFWVDSGPDKIESCRLDGRDRKVLFDTDLVNPRAIIVDSASGTLYWTDWNRDAPKIESSTVEGHGRRVVVRDGIGLPNALTFDPSARQICWADAGTKRLECIAPDGTGRRVINSNLNYPFSLVSYANHFYYTDWRRDGVIALNRDSGQFTDEYLPDQRSHLYGITVCTFTEVNGQKTPVTCFLTHCSYRKRTVK
uniref:Nidogen 2 n=1 Tax=Scleropages formosus TaxID=113540 RepID=A0A8C9VUN5_SCLFO